MDREIKISFTDQELNFLKSILIQYQYCYPDPDIAIGIHDKVEKKLAEVMKICTTMGELIITLKGVDMSKPELKDLLKSFEGYLNDIPLVIDPCRMCKNHDDNKGFSETCSMCCWFYDSKFEVKNDTGRKG